MSSTGVIGFAGGNRYCGPRRYCLDIADKSALYDVESLDHLYRIIAFRLQPHFGSMSVEALSYRVRDIGIVMDTTRDRFTLRRSAKTKTLTPYSKSNVHTKKLLLSVS